MGPWLLTGGFVFIAGKAGLGYLLHANDLGGIGGQVAVARVCNGVAQGGTATVGSQIFVPCFDGLRRVLDPSGTKLVLDWRASAQIKFPPIVGGHTLYSPDYGGTLYALHIDNGLIPAKPSFGFRVPPFVPPALFPGAI